MLKKKFMCIALCLVVAIGCCMSSFALTTYEQKQQIINRIDAGFNVDGTQVYCPANYRNQAVNYLNSTNLTTDKLDYIDNKITQVEDLIVSNHIKSEAELKANEPVYNQVEALCLEAADYLGVTVVYVPGVGYVIVYDSDGNAIIDNGDIIKDTGAESVNYLPLIAFGGASILAIAFSGLAIRNIYRRRCENEQ